jgi:hypothetical protein
LVAQRERSRADHPTARALRAGEPAEAPGPAPSPRSADPGPVLR